MFNLKVFVSSPIKGLELERRTAKEALDMLGFRYFISEHDISSLVSSFNHCLSNVRDSDIFILLLGDIYGWIPNNEKYSITELEFREAKKLNLPIFVFKMRRENVELKQQKFIKMVEDFYKGYFRGKVIDSLDELKERIMHDISFFLSYIFKQNVIGEEIKCPLCHGEGIISVKNKVIMCSKCGVDFISGPINRGAGKMNSHAEIKFRIKKAIEVGIRWINASQNIDGGWGSTIGMSSDSANTSNSIHTLNLFYKYQNNIDIGIDWLINTQSEDGGWGLYKDIENTIFCTSVSILALQIINRKKYTTIIKKGLNWIKKAQNKDGSWGRIKNSDGNIHETFLVLRVLSSEQNYRNELEKGVNWLLLNQKKNRGWGFIKETISNAHLTSEVIGFLSTLNRKEYYSQILNGINWLKEHQNINGSWSITPETFNNTATQFYNLLICNEDVNNEYMQRTLKWILNKQLSDGGWASYLPNKRGSVNVTAMTIRALITALNKLE